MPKPQPVPIPPLIEPPKPVCVLCGKPAKFRSARLDASFCSDGCYEQAQRGESPDEAHIVVTRKQGAYFQQGDIKFPVSHHNLELTLAAGSYKQEQSCIDKLMDSQVVSLATANGLPVEPYVRELIRSPLHGIVQLVWYRDLKHRVDFDHLNKGQAARIAEYKRKLAVYVAPAEGSGNGRRKPRKASAKSQLWSKIFRATKDARGVASGRERQLYDVIKGMSQGGTFAQIVEASKDKVRTRQDLTKVVARFLKELLAHNAVEEVQ